MRLCDVCANGTAVLAPARHSASSFSSPPSRLGARRISTQKKLHCPVCGSNPRRRARCMECRTSCSELCIKVQHVRLHVFASLRPVDPRSTPDRAQGSVPNRSHSDHGSTPNRSQIYHRSIQDRCLSHPESTVIILPYSHTIICAYDHMIS